MLHSIMTHRIVGLAQTAGRLHRLFQMLQLASNNMQRNITTFQQRGYFLELLPLPPSLTLGLDLPFPLPLPLPFSLFLPLPLPLPFLEDSDLCWKETVLEIVGEGDLLFVFFFVEDFEEVLLLAELVFFDFPPFFFLLALRFSFLLLSLRMDFGVGDLPLVETSL